MLKHSDIISAFGDGDGAASLAKMLSQVSGTKIQAWVTNKWKQRNKIPLDWWPDVVAVAKEHKIKVDNKSITLAVIAGAKQGVA